MAEERSAGLKSLQARAAGIVGETAYGRKAPAAIANVRKIIDEAYALGAGEARALARKARAAKVSEWLEEVTDDQLRDAWLLFRLEQPGRAARLLDLLEGKAAPRG